MSHSQASSSSSRISRRSTKPKVASRACESCRRRKLKCDERRPKCGHCLERELDCDYRTPITEQLAETTDTIMTGLQSLETKLNAISQGRSDRTSPSHVLALQSPSSLSTTASQSTQPDRRNYGFPSFSSTAKSEFSAAQRSRLARGLTVPHSIILWPAVRDYLLRTSACSSSELDSVVQQGTAWFVKLELESQLSILPAQIRLTMAPSRVVAPLAASVGAEFLELHFDQMLQCTEAYFNTFNVLSPILSQDGFTRNVLQFVMHSGFVEGDGRSVVALFVFALGAVAIEGASQDPVSVTDRQPSGIRGGTTRQPPGLAAFNEARRRVGTLAIAHTLEKVQALLLQATYFQCAARYVEFWHSTTAASMACLALIRVRTGSDWKSPHGDMIKRAYWACVISEEFFHVDLDLPKTSIADIQDEVPLPHFHEIEAEKQADETVPVDQRLETNLTCFVALNALRRIITRTHAVLQDPDEGLLAYGGARLRVLSEMAQQLVLWHEALPATLRWVDHEDEQQIEPLLSAASQPPVPDSGGHEGSQGNPSSSSRSSLSNEGRHGQLKRSHPPLGTYRHPAHEQVRLGGGNNLGANPTDEGFNWDVAMPSLQTRFYYARFLVYLPFVYKALHAPRELSEGDIEGCRIAIKSACNWPIASAPPQNKKRLVPDLFTWTQNFIGSLLILRMAMESPDLRRICEDLGERIDRAVMLMLDWIYDVKQIDNIAQWGWQMLEPLFFRQMS